ncbi:hypothetical protein PMAC_003046 [Pneumocystis sp. 'macacae']|nr:hypothetical protein PMAC_003046 [Pneumocystis sp. 'macacae']
MRRRRSIFCVLWGGSDESRLCDDPQVGVQEQALDVIRNVICGQQEVGFARGHEGAPEPGFEGFGNDSSSDIRERVKTALVCVPRAAASNLRVLVSA